MNIYTTNGHIVRRLEKASQQINHEDHAEADAYLRSFRNIEDKFFSEVHPFVDVGLAISETRVAGGSDLNIYTIHGSRHISDLIKSLDKLVLSVEENNSGKPFTVLECYVLLCAAHVHDAANVDERNDHAEQCRYVINKYETLFTSSLVRQQIYDVARVHGGRHERYGKDTTRSLLVDDTKSLRSPLLASLLRIGDELSENSERVPNLVTEHHEPSEASKLAHAYAKSFCLFKMSGETLSLIYNLYPSQKNLTVGDNPTGCRTFVDFLELKINVIEYEARYCSQYGRPSLNISTISVSVRLYKEELPSPIHTEVSFDLQLKYGYPDQLVKLCDRSAQLRDKNVSSLNDYLSLNTA